MYLRQLQIENLKLIRELVLRFNPRPDVSEGMWTVMIGRNGRGKTSLLRAVAAAAFGAAHASNFAERWLYSISDRRNEVPPRSTIGAWFPFGSKKPKSNAVPDDAVGFVSWLGYTFGDSAFVGRTKLHRNDLGNDRKYDLWLFEGDGPIESPSSDGQTFVLNDPNSRLGDPASRLGPGDEFIVEARRKNLDRLFVAAYGNTRRLHRPGTIETRSGPIHRVASLFDPDFRLTGLDFFKNVGGNGRAERFRELLKVTLFRGADLMQDVVGLDLGDLAFDDSGVPDEIQQDQTYTATLDLPGGPIEVPTAWLADGQQALLSWLADLIGHLMLDQKDVTDPADFEGLVLVDDIDLHIHPDWQTRLVPALKRAFPKLQFIVTTHSPLIISSLRPEEVVVLDLDKEGNIQASHLEVDPRLLTSAELYRHVFGVQNTPPDPIHRTLRRYEHLARDGIRTADEQARMLRLREKLEAAGVRDLFDPEPWQQDGGEA